MCVKFLKNGGKDPTTHITSCSFITYMAVKNDIKIKCEQRSTYKSKCKELVTFQQTQYKINGLKNAKACKYGRQCKSMHMDASDDTCFENF